MVSLAFFVPSQKSRLERIRADVGDAVDAEVTNRPSIGASGTILNLGEASKFLPKIAQEHTLHQSAETALTNRNSYVYPRRSFVFSNANPNRRLHK